MSDDRKQSRIASPLTEAVRAGDEAEVRRRMRAGADPNALDDEGQHPLEVAAWTGRATMVRLLMDLGADAGSKQHAAVVTAAQRGHADVLRLLLAAGADPNQPDECGCLGLCGAATGGYLEAVRLLIEAGADPRAVDADENSPLRGAALRSSWDVVDYLMSLSAPKDQKEARQLRERFDRRVREKQDEAQALNEAAEAMAARPGIGGTRYASVREAVAIGDGVAVGKLLAAGADVNEADPVTGRTALMLAAERGDAVTLRHLIDASADLDACDRGHAFALLLAARGGHAAVVEALADAGANARTHELSGESPVLAAAKNGHWAVAEFLAPRSTAEDRAQAKTLRRIAEQGASAEAARRLTDVARAGDQAAVERILDGGLPVDVVNVSGQTALLAAANGGHPGLVRRLLERGADPSLSDNYGQTALDLAAGNAEVATFDALWPLASAKQRRAAMKTVALNRMLPQQYPKWQGYEPPADEGTKQSLAESRQRGKL